MIVLAIKSCFFSGVDSYNLGRKSHTCHFFFSFCEKIIRVVFAMFAIAIEDLEVQLNNSNLPIRKSAICFELLAQKGKISKQMTSALYYKYKKSVS